MTTQDLRTLARCDQCKEPILPQSISGPLVVSIKGPKLDGRIEVRFCSWQCLALWANEQAGGILMPDLDAAFFRKQIMA
jgi:hypothetical protein